MASVGKDEKEQFFGWAFGRRFLKKQAWFFFQTGVRGMGEALLENRCRGEVFTGSTKRPLMLRGRLDGCQETSRGRVLPGDGPAES